jgi:iron complex outermembrane receptor protein
MRSFKQTLLATAFALSAGAALAQSAPQSYAEVLVQRTLSGHPELNAVTFHVQPPNGPDNIIIASNIAPYGKKADQDDLAVVGGKVIQEPSRSGDRFGVELPLLNREGRVIGALALGFVFKAGDDKSGFLAKAEAIRNELAARIASEGQLVGRRDQAAANAQDVDKENSFLDTHERSAFGTTNLNTPITDENFSGAFQKATGAVTPEDSYKYTNNLSKAGTTGYDLTLRGFTTTVSDRGAIITDGLPGATVRYGAPPNAAVDHVEVIKGPAAVLYGAGQPGGFVNIVTKKPTEDSFTNFDVTGRLTPEDDYHKQHEALLDRGGALGSVDVNGSLTDDKSLLGRLIVYGVDQNGWRDFSYDHQFMVKPMLDWRVSDRTEIYGSVENREAQSDDYIGMVAPKNNVKLMNPRPETSYQNPGDFITEYGFAEVVGMNHTFDNNMKFDFEARDVHHQDYSSGFENNHVQGDYQTLQRLLSHKENNRDYSFLNSNLQIPLDVLGFNNRIVVGVYGGRDYLQTTRFQYLTGNSTTLNSLNISIYDPYGGTLNYYSAHNPGSYALCGSGGPGTTTTNACNKNMIVQTTNQVTMGYRVSDLVSLSDQWKVLLAERYDGDWDHFSQVAVTPVAGINPNSTYTQYYIHQDLPLLSLIYEPIKDQLSLYATYATGFVPAGGNNNDIHGNPITVPATARSYEFGAKTNYFGGKLKGTLALFDIQKENTVVSVACASDAPSGVACFAPSTTHSKGVEAQADWRVTENWHNIIGYSYTLATIASSPDPYSIGAFATNTPRHSAHLWSRYDFTPELGVGVGEALIDQRFGTIPTTPTACTANNGDSCWTNIAMKLPGYAVTDLAGYYKLNPVDFTLKIANLFNHNYLQSAGSGTNLKIITGDPFNITLTAHIAFKKVIEPSNIGTQEPPTVAMIPSAVFFAVVRNKLGRPISTPCQIV